MTSSRIEDACEYENLVNQEIFVECGIPSQLTHIIQFTIYVPLNCLFPCEFSWAENNKIKKNYSIFEWFMRLASCVLRMKNYIYFVQSHLWGRREKEKKFFIHDIIFTTRWILWMNEKIVNVRVISESFTCFKRYFFCRWMSHEVEKWFHNREIILRNLMRFQEKNYLE